MAYDKELSSGQRQLVKKQRIWRLDFERPAVPGSGGSVTATSFLREDLIDDTSGSATYGSVLSSKDWIVNTVKDQFDGFNGFGPFFNSMINLISDMKAEYDASGSVATGSVSPLA